MKKKKTNKTDNPIAKELCTGEFFKPRIVKNKKGKGAYDRKDRKRLSFVRKEAA